MILALYAFGVGYWLRDNWHLLRGSAAGPWAKAFASCLWALAWPLILPAYVALYLLDRNNPL